jgi:hypothetical protein
MPDWLSDVKQTQTLASTLGGRENWPCPHGNC